MMRKQRVFTLLLCMILLTGIAFPTDIAAIQDSPYQQFINRIDTRTDLHGDRPFAVQDVTGDGVPELIYVTRGERQSDSYAYATIHIMQFSSQGIREIIGGYGESMDFGPQEKGMSILEIFAAKDYLVIGTGCGDIEENEYPVKREYIWYRYNGTEMKKSEVLGYLILEKNKREASFYYGQNERQKSSLTEAQYKSYLETKIKNVFKNKEPILAMSGKDGRLISTDMDRGLTAAEAKKQFNDLDRTFTGFFDVPGNAWYAGAVEDVSQIGWMTGTAPYVFSPNLKVSRAQAVMVLYRLEGSPYVNGGSFYDMKVGDWYYDAVEWAAKNKIVTGYGYGNFGPNDPLSREQLAAILYRYVKEYKHYQTDAEGDIYDYDDYWRISDYAIEPMEWAVRRGLISGNDKHQLDPKGTATRAQFATILQRFNWQNFKLIKFAVEFEMNDGSGRIYYNSRVDYGDRVSRPGNDPERDGYRFEGWYLDEEGTEPYSFGHAVDEDLTLYAKWEKKEQTLSDWTPAENAPSGAEIVERKYYYTKTSYTTSTSSNLAGWTQYDVGYDWGSYGNWSAWSDSPYYEYTTDSSQREVQTTSVYVKTQWQYSHYVNSAKTYTAPTWKSGYAYHICGEYAGQEWLDYQLVSAGYSNEGGVPMYQGWCPSCNKSMKFYNETSRDVYKTQYRYRDRSKVYTYYYEKTEQLSSGTYPSGSGISNIQEYVRYLQ